VSYGRLAPRRERIDVLASAPATPVGTAAGQKHPVLALGPAGDALLAWTAGTGWNRGGDLYWQRFDARGNPSGGSERIANGIPVWGFPAVAVRKSGSFLLTH
jgi:hypothetical protein